ncbi:MAG: DUF262 domain-containing protein [Rhodospirillales bacterium]|nr:DUF262 domain-containing protein [Rhodospirillales bacterium]
MRANPQHPQRLFGHPVHYEIPAFQRRYVWKQEEQWEPLWDDIEELARSIKDEESTEFHFMGAVVLKKTDFATATIERRTVVDGQQRLTTLQLLMNAIQEVLEDREHSTPSRRLSRLVVNEEEYRAGNPDHAFKVWPTTVDRDAYRHAMSNESTTTGYAGARIVQAHEYFKAQAEQWLDQFAQGSGERERAADALEEAVSRRLEIVVIDLGESDDPHVIFETLNARGTPLLQSDMVKNKLLHEAEIVSEDDGETTDEEQEIWPFGQEEWWAVEVGRGLQRRPRVDVYLNHWLTLRNREEMKPYDEFRAFDRYADNRKAAGETIGDIARDLSDVGMIFRDVEDIRIPEIGKFLERRKVMNVGVVTPLLLWLLDADLPLTRLASCLTALESFLVRRVICGYSARSYGDLFVGLIRKLSESGTTDADQVVVSYLGGQTAQGGLWPDDKEMRRRLVTAPLYWHLTRGRLRMVLEAIEGALRTNKAETGEVPGDLQIEHIMPQTWHPHWPLPDKLVGDPEAIGTRDRLVHTIGNLTLVNGRLNPALSNAPWDKKRKTLADHSVLFLNKRLVNKGPDVWDEAAIEERAEWLHKRVVKVWPHAATVPIG